MSDQTSSPLDNAPEEIKLAVDIIYLLETNEIDPEVALKAIKIVQSDLENTINRERTGNLERTDDCEKDKE